MLPESTDAPSRAGRRHPKPLPPDVERLDWACEQMGIASSTGYRLCQTGKMPGAFRAGKQWRISVPAFQAAIHGQ